MVSIRRWRFIRPTAVGIINATQELLPFVYGSIPTTKFEYCRERTNRNVPGTTPRRRISKIPIRGRSHRNITDN